MNADSLSYLCHPPCILSLCAVQQILDAKDVRAAPSLAPAHGLYLAYVAYEGLGKNLPEEHLNGQ